MRIYLILFACCLSLVACKPNAKSNSDTENVTESSQGAPVTAEHPAPAEPTASNGTQLRGEATTEDPADNPGNELASYFTPFGGEFYSTCHSEKGISDDYFNGKEIPKLLVDKYDLYDFAISPTVARQFSAADEAVVIKGGPEIEMGGKRLWIYSIGINLELDEAETAGVDIHALVVDAQGTTESNYFVGGMIRQPGEGISVVCRKLTYEKEMLKLTVLKEQSQNLPTHLRLKNETFRSLD